MKKILFAIILSLLSLVSCSQVVEQPELQTNNSVQDNFFINTIKTSANTTEFYQCEAEGCRYAMSCQCDEARDHPVNYSGCFEEMKSKFQLLSEQEQNTLNNYAEAQVSLVNPKDTNCDSLPRNLTGWIANDGSKILSAECNNYPPASEIAVVSGEVYICNFYRGE